MCGRELVGIRTREGDNIKYTDWGNLSIELMLGLKGKPGERVNLNQELKEGQSVLEFLLNSIQNDCKGTIPYLKWTALPDADCRWLIEQHRDGAYLFDPMRYRYLRH